MTGVRRGKIAGVMVLESTKVVASSAHSEIEMVVAVAVPVPVEDWESERLLPRVVKLRAAHAEEQPQKAK